MLCPFMTLNDGTEIVCSSSIRNGNQEQVRVQIETPVENGFKSATCIEQLERATTTSSAGGVENALAIRFEQSEMTKKLSSLKMHFAIQLVRAVGQVMQMKDACSRPLEGLCQQDALLGLTQATGSAGGFDSAGVSMDEQWLF